MACGDYVPCPLCGHAMIYGNPVCGTCLATFNRNSSDAKLTWGQPYTQMKEPTLNELADEIFVEEKDFLEAMLPPQDKYKQTLVVNLFAGPGTGKSTACSGIFFELKNRQVNCEIASEYAKDLVWEKRTSTFEDQIYLFAKQHHRIFVLLGQVDVVITDCPILLSPVYDAEKRPTFEKLVVEEHKKMWTYNVFLKRRKAYNPKGRLHTESQAHEIDRAVLDVLDRNGECYEVFDASIEGKDQIVKKIQMLLGHAKVSK